MERAWLTPVVDTHRSMIKSVMGILCDDMNHKI